MMVSAQCITYGRPELLEEAIESFLKQDYQGDREMVVLNDHPGQRLFYEHPEIHIINIPRRFRTVGEKRNACVAMCSGDVIFPWDDDDISLPWRISKSLEYKGTKPYFKNTRAWLWQNGKIKPEPPKNVYHSMGCWDRTYFEAVEGYPMVQSGHDAGIEKRFEKKGGRHVEEIPIADIWYIYRFGGTGHPHLSSYGYGNGWTEIGRREERDETESVHLRPGWREDYVAQVEEVRMSILSGKQEAKSEAQASGVPAGG